MSAEVQGIRTSTADYQYALEGVGYATTILKNAKQQLDDMVSSLNHEEVLGGETGKEICKKLDDVVEVVDAVIKRYNAFADAVIEVCRKNGAFIDNNVMNDFDKAQKAFAQKAQEIASFNGKKRG